MSARFLLTANEPLIPRDYCPKSPFVQNKAFQKPVSLLAGNRHSMTDHAGWLTSPEQAAEKLI